MQEKENNSFGIYLRNKLEQVSMSIRKLAQECGYDPATISRLINGKQTPRQDHLVKIAQVLRVPVIELWQAASGQLIDQSVTSQHHFQTTKKIISQQTETDLGFYSLPSMETIDTSRIIAELEKYRLYAQTDEGQGLILQNFDKKVGQLGIGPFIDKLKNMYQLYLDENTALEQKHIIGSVLLYFILPTDIIPDYLFPTGYLDDAMAIDIVWKHLQSLLENCDK